MFSIVRELSKKSIEKRTLNYSQQSFNNIILYGNNGKSTIAASLSEKTEEPVLILSPANASSHLADQFSNAIFYSINNLIELNAIINDLSKNMEIIKKIKNNIDFPVRIASIKEDFLKEYEKEDKKKAEEDWNECYSFGKNGNFPISAIVLEEIDLVSSWIQDQVESKMNLTLIGNDKKLLGQDWNELKSVIMDFYSKLLKLEVTTIFCTSDKLPSEKQGLTQIVPSICVGAANRLLLNLIGNVFYVGSDKGKYYIRLIGNKDIFIKSKFVPVNYLGKVEEELDVSHNPVKFWDYLESFKIKQENKIEDKPKNTK